MPNQICSTAALACVVAVGLAAQQPPQQAPAKPDTPAITDQVERLKKTVGPRWADAVHFWCEAPRANRADDPVIEPTKIFDNVFAIGSVGTVAYVIQTSAGLMMIDALGANEVDSRLLPGFAKLGLDPHPGTPEALATVIQAETAKWAKVVKASGAKIE